MAGKFREVAVRIGEAHNEEHLLGNLAAAEFSLSDDETHFSTPKSAGKQ